MKGLTWSKSYLSLCTFYMLKFTSHENISRLWVCLHKDDSVYNTSWVSRSIHHTGTPYQCLGTQFLGSAPPSFEGLRHPAPPAPLCETKVITLLCGMSVKGIWHSVTDVVSSELPRCGMSVKGIWHRVTDVVSSDLPRCGMSVKGIWHRVTDVMWFHQISHAVACQ